jgi:serine/threonine protein kinase/Flp pilus assembly protein TadD
MTGSLSLEPTSEVIRILEVYLEELEAGARPDPEKLAARCPELAEPLKACLASLDFLQDAALGLRGPGQTGQAAAEVVPELRRLGDFHLLREVGRGGMGVVYEAEQQSLGRRVALKVLPFAAALDARQLQRFKNEALAAAGLHHPNIVPVFGVGCERGIHYYAMQLIDGRTLAAFIEELRRGGAASLPGSPSSVTPPIAAWSTERSASGPAHFRTAARLALQAAEALEYAHQLGVIHRDVKPANLLVDGRGNLWVTDFGLAHCQSLAELTLTGDLIGTLRYMSPEQALAQRVLLDHRTDIYSLGATLHELVTLSPPFNGRDRQELLRQIALEEPPQPRQISRAVPVELETIVLKAMAKNPLERYATAQELADDLRRFLEDKPIRARRPSCLEQARKWARRHRPVVWSALVAALVTLAVLAGSVGWIVRDRAARQARLSADAAAAVQEARRYQREGKWPQALAAARHAETLLGEGAPEPALAERVQGLLCELTEQEADGRLRAALEAIRLGQAAVQEKENRFSLPEAVLEYRRAFAEYGLTAEAMTPEEAAARLRRRPAAVRGPTLAALDHWLILARYKKAPEAPWLERVLAAADSDPWRQGVRSARGRNDRQALEKLAREVDVAAQPPEALFVLEVGLRQRGAIEAAAELLRRAQEAFPGDFWINHDLGLVLQECQPPRREEAIRFLMVAVALRPASSKVRLNLGTALWRNGQVDEAITTFRKAIHLKPDCAEAHASLGGALVARGQIDQAMAPIRRALELWPECAEAHHTLGNALSKKGRLDEAVAAHRRAIELKPGYAEAHCDLGLVLWRQGEFTGAIAALKRGHELGSRHRNWPYPSAQWLKMCRRAAQRKGPILAQPDH